jgi:DNA mismatch repair ATPase MutL
LYSALASTDAERSKLPPSRRELSSFKQSKAGLVLRQRPGTAPGRQVPPFHIERRPKSSNVSSYANFNEELRSCMPTNSPKQSLFSQGLDANASAKSYVGVRQLQLKTRRAKPLHRPKSAQQVSQGFSRVAPEWKNPCFPSTSRSKRIASATGLPVPGRSSAGDLVLDMQKIRILRDDIPRLRVIGQADAKFILVIDESGVVYAVDQHAASERHHYELLQCVALDPSDGIQPATPSEITLIALTPIQAATAKTHEAHLLRWGWKLEPIFPIADGMFAIAQVPEVVATKLTIDSPARLSAHLNALAAGTSLNAMPHSILEALASAACHAAVRFGDALTHSQCCSIVRALADCDVPFLCAHGRPSIVPLVVL